MFQRFSDLTDNHTGSNDDSGILNLSKFFLDFVRANTGNFADQNQEEERKLDNQEPLYIQERGDQEDEKDDQ